MQKKAKVAKEKWEPYTEGGRERTSLDLFEWITEALGLGVGEVFLSSIDKDGTKSGLDDELINSVAEICTVPLIVGGGIGKPENLLNAALNPKIDAFAIATAFHYNLCTIKETKEYLSKNLIKVRA